MKKGEHTPGPWTAQPWSVERGITKEWVIDSPAWKDLAHVYVQDDDTATECELGDGDANARLIAAAPDLLDVLREIYRRLPLLTLIKERDCVEILIREAIWKARGEK